MTESIEGMGAPVSHPAPGLCAGQRGRSRLRHDERERMIVDEAIRFFAEVGFEGQTRVLADRLGVTQPLLYRYFPDKSALIERVCREVFELWREDWSTLLADTSLPLEQRLTRLYCAYVRTSFTHERARLFLFATLRDPVLAGRHLAHLRTMLFVPLCREVRRGLGDTSPVTPREIDLAASLHGAIGYAVLCRRTLPRTTWNDLDASIATLVSTFVGALRHGHCGAPN